MEEFRIYTNKLQRFHYETLDESEYDEIQPNDSRYFEKILCNYVMADVASKLYHNMNFKKPLCYRILMVSGHSKDGSFHVPVIKVREHSDKEVFYDHECRKYQSWDDYLSNNTLPSCTMIFPSGGIYKKLGNSNEVKLDVKEHTRVAHFIGSCIYISCKVLSTACSAAPLFSFMKPYATTVDVISGVCNGCIVARHSHAIYDRKTHGQSISLSDEEASKHWSLIGEGFMNFGLTVAAMHVCKPSEEMTVFNIASMIQKSLVVNDITKSTTAIRNQFLMMNLFVVSDEALAYFQTFIAEKPMVLIEDIVFKLKNYVRSAQGGTKNKVRSLFYVDDPIMRNAVNSFYQVDITEIGTVSLYDVVSENHKMSEAILKEIEKWGERSITTVQLIFRIDCICRGEVPYETNSEMCAHFNVEKKEDIEVNGMRIFEGVSENLTDFLGTSVTQFPQLLSYFVKYAEKCNDKAELDGFRDSFLQKATADACQGFGKLIVPNISWINALTCKELSYTRSIPSNEIHFVRPPEINCAPIKKDALFILAKKLMGRVGHVDFKFVKPDVEWIVAVSKVSKLAVIVGPKITADIGSVKGSYPAFKRYF